MERAYAQALHSLIKGGMPQAEAYKKLEAHLKETGRLKILPQLLSELRMLSARSKAREPMLEVASEKEAPLAEKEAKKEGASVRAQVNHDLIQGWRLTTADTLVDRSGKRALIDLYRTITKS